MTNAWRAANINWSQEQLDSMQRAAMTHDCDLKSRKVTPEMADSYLIACPQRIRDQILEECAQLESEDGIDDCSLGDDTEERDQPGYFGGGSGSESIGDGTEL